MEDKFAKEDKLFFPKRKIDNVNSKHLPHMTGGFKSDMMSGIVEYESLGERLLYHTAEISSKIARYYFQPIDVPVYFYDKNGELDSWSHVPDVLIIFKNGAHLLLQIKSSDEELSKKDINIEKACQDYCSERGWFYSLVYPKRLDHTVQRNINFLFGYYRRRVNSQLAHRLASCLKANGPMTVDELVSALDSDFERIITLPMIYQEIAKSNIFTDISIPVTCDSQIRAASESDKDFFDFILELL